MTKLGVFAVVAATCVLAGAQQREQVNYVADTVVISAEGHHEMDPDLATLTFDVSAQEKELKVAYQKAGDAIRKIVGVAEKNGVEKSAMETGALSLTPFFEGDRKKRARSYRVQGQIVLKLRDFAKIGPILDDSVEEGIIDFRSLTYSLADEETAKQRAVADAMRSAIGRAKAVLDEHKQKLGPVRYVNVDVKQLVSMHQVPARVLSESVEVQSGLFYKAAAPPPPPMPMIQPQKITITANVMCVFQIQ